jgi:HAD superfamily hydrolase (TIGR01509 family)
MALTAILFDVDGTLIGTNAAHVDAWDQALKKHHYGVASDRIAVEIGKGGDKLIPSILGSEAEARLGESLRKAHTVEYVKIAESRQLPVFPGTRELLTELRSRGLKLAMATSSKPDELHVTEKSAGIDLSGFFDVIATGEDAKDSKPAPAIAAAAVKKLGVSPGECLMVGDTPYDADSARDAGLVCFGFTCGGMHEGPALRATGMRQVYRDPADLLAQIDRALQSASPGSAVLTTRLMEHLVTEALSVARESMDHGEIPIGCVIARGDGTIIARGHNQQNASQVKTAHAEIVAFGQTAGKVPLDARDLILVSTLEPCVMCLGAAMEAAVDTILFALPAPADGGTLRVRPPVSPESKMPRIVGKIFVDQSRLLFQEFLQRSDNPVQINFVRQLLA